MHGQDRGLEQKSQRKTMKDQITQAIVRRLLPKYGAKFNSDIAWAWSQVTAAGQASTDEGKSEMIKALSGTKVIKAHLMDLAESEAVGLLADGNLSVTELERIL